MSTRTLLCIIGALLLSASAFAASGVVHIDQATVVAAGGFPYHITKSGSYRLSGNLKVSQFGVDAIDITADDVTLDLNGFSILGPCSASPCAGSPGDGISSTNNDITVRHGTVKFMNNGISLTGSNNVVEEIRAANNLADGIKAGIFIFLGRSAGMNMVRHCIVSLNGGIGIETFGSLVESNVASGNGDFGISVAGFSGSVLANTLDSNAGGGVECANCIVGSNDFDNINPIRDFGGFVSQGNNNCNGHLC